MKKLSVLAASLVVLLGCAASPLLTGGKVQITLDDYERAIELFREHIEQNPQDPEGYLWLGIAYGRSKKYEEATEAFDKAIELDSLHLNKMKTSKPDQFWGGTTSYWVVYVNSGIGLLNKQDFNSAEKRFLRAAEIQPDSSASYNHLGYVYSKLGKDEDALRAYETAVKLGPKNLEAHINLASSLIKGEEYDQALGILGKALSIGPSLPEDMSKVYEDLGIPEETFTMESQGRVIETWKYWSKGVSVSFSSGKQLSKETFPSITPAKRSCVSPVFGGLSRAWYLQGICYSQKEENEEAENAFRKATELNAENKDAFYNLGIVCLKQEKLSEAEGAFERTVELSPEDEDAWFQLGTTHYQLEKYQEAVDAFTKVIELNPTNADAYENRGYALSQLGLKKEAYKDIETAERIRGKR